MASRTSTASYSADSWSFVDAARSILEPGRRLGDILGTRDFVNVPWRNDSFPWLWPALLAPGIAAWGPDKPIGGLAFIAIWLTTGLALRWMMRQLHLSPVLAPLACLSMLSIPGYVNEGHAGRSIPLNLLLLTTCLGGLHWERPGFVRPLIVGSLLGLCAANRFDSLLAGPVVISVALVFRMLTWKQAAVTLAAWCVPALSWVAYSLGRLGGVYVTDNGRVAFSPVPTFVTDWPTAIGTSKHLGFGLPGKMLGNIPVVITSLTLAYRYWILAGVLAVAGALLARKRFDRWFCRLDPFPLPAPDRPADDRRQVAFLASLAAALLGLHGGLMLTTAYGETRYWGGVSLVLLVLILSVTPHTPVRFGRGLVPLFFFLASGLGLAVVVREYRQVTNQGAGDAQMARCVDAAPGVPIIVGMEAFRLPATTNLRAALPPNNAASMTSQHWAELREAYGISTWINATGERSADLPPMANGILMQVTCAYR